MASPGCGIATGAGVTIGAGADVTGLSSIICCVSKAVNFASTAAAAIAEAVGKELMAGAGVAIDGAI